MEHTTESQFNSDSRIAGLLLAAGASKRVGALNKLLFLKQYDLKQRGLKQRGLKQSTGSTVSLLTKSAQTLLATGIKTVVAVTSESHHQVVQQLQSLGFDIVNNPDAEQGMGTSLKLGLLHLQHAEAVLVCLADMPDVKSSTLGTILNCWQQSSRDKYIVPMYQGKRGNPVIIPNCYYSEFAEHNGDIGARAVMQQNPTQVLICEVDDPAILVDYDTQEQLQTAGWVAPTETL